MSEIGDTYTCAVCSNEYLKGVDDETAMEETKEIFGDVKQEDCDIVCDDCFRAMGLAD